GPDGSKSTLLELLDLVSDRNVIGEERVFMSLVVEDRIFRRMCFFFGVPATVHDACQVYEGPFREAERLLEACILEMGEIPRALERSVPVMGGKRKRSPGCQEAPYLLQDFEPVRMIDVVDPVKAEDDQIEGRRREF